jgi:uncharacterized membrane protein YraQ (UPF0718 family)
MIEIISRELIYFFFYFSVQFQQIFKYWLIGMTIGSVVSVFGKEKIHALFSSLQDKKSGVLILIPASLLGIASPLCMYGTIPIAASFAKKGMKEDVLAAFMMSSVLLNPQLMFYSAALGTTALVIRFTASFLCGIAAGIVIKILFKNKFFFNFSGFDVSENRDTDPNIFFRFLKNFARNVRATGLFFLAGIALSALFQHYVPPGAFVKLFGSNNGFGILMAATIGVPLYVCGGGTIPLIQSWLQRGMSMGAAVSFMIAGPAMKITNLGALKIVLGLKHFIFYLLFAVLFSFITGLLINLLI